MTITINEAGADHPVRFNIGGIEVWARSSEHARSLLDAWTKRAPCEPDQVLEAQPAPVLRRYGLNTSGKIFMLDNDQPDSAGYFVNLNDHRDLVRELVRLLVKAVPYCIVSLQDEIRTALRKAGRT